MNREFQHQREMQQGPGQQPTNRQAQQQPMGQQGQQPMNQQGQQPMGQHGGFQPTSQQGQQPMGQQPMGQQPMGQQGQQQPMDQQPQQMGGQLQQGSMGDSQGQHGQMTGHGSGRQMGGQQMGGQQMSGQQMSGQQFDDHFTDELRIVLEDFDEVTHIAEWCGTQCAAAGPELADCARICADIAELAELNEKLIARDSMFGPEVADLFVRVATEGLSELQRHQQHHPHIMETVATIERTINSCTSVLESVGQGQGQGQPQTSMQGQGRGQSQMPMQGPQQSQPQQQF